MERLNATAIIVRHLKRRAMTYAEMMAPEGQIISTSPQKRVREWLMSNENWRPVYGVIEKQIWDLRIGKRWQGGRRYLTTWRLVRA